MKAILLWTFTSFLNQICFVPMECFFVLKKDLKRKLVSGYLDQRNKDMLELWSKSKEGINSFQDRYTLFAPSDHPQAPKVLLSFPFIVHCILSIGSEFVALL